MKREISGNQELTNFAPQNPAVLEEQRGYRANYFALFFAFFRFSRVFPVATRYIATTSSDPTPPKKIMPKTLP
jgi:hypothetical protein